MHAAPLRRACWPCLYALALAACTAAPQTAAQRAAPTAAAGVTSDQVLARAAPSDWRSLDPANTLYLDLPAGRVTIELAPDFAPAHVANIKTLVRAHYFDGLYVMRVQDDYVVQWGDPEEKRDQGHALQALPAEYTRPLAGLPFTPLADGDVYAPQVGWSQGFAVARDPAAGQAWLTHCYGAVGVARDNPPDTGNGAELYAVIGQAPRQLDRNLAVAGRVIRGMELLAALPRGTEALGFYAKPAQYVPIRSAHIAADLPPEQRSPIRVLRADTPTWQAYVESRRNRAEGFFVQPAGHIDVCNVTVPVRT